MKLLTISLVLIFSVLFSSASYADWTKFSKDTIGNIFYVDFERIRKHDGYVYYWSMVDYLKPVEGALSVRTYRQGDCKLFRDKLLSFHFHNEPMGRGTGENYSPENPKWSYPPPNSSSEYILKAVCE